MLLVDDTYAYMYILVLNPEVSGILSLVTVDLG